MEALEAEILAAVRQLDEEQQQRLLVHIVQMLEAPSEEEWTAMTAELAHLYVPGSDLDMTGELEAAELLRQRRAKAG
jgi:hypothetical protein